MGDPRSALRIQRFTLDQLEYLRGNDIAVLLPCRRSSGDKELPTLTIDTLNENFMFGPNSPRKHLRLSVSKTIRRPSAVSVMAGLPNTFHPFLYADDPILLEELVTGIKAL